MLSNKFYYNFKPYKVFSSIITKADIILLKKFSSNDSIVVCKPDKGNGVVIMDRNDYLSKVHKILSDKSKFNLVHENIHTTILHVEDRINRFINKLKKTKEISLELYNSLFVSGSNPGILYGLPKIHKVGNPMRPIFSAINTPSYNICKFFVPILKKLTTNEFTTDNSYNFVEKISNFKNTKNLYMVSYDVESLFTNIPLEETINICILELFKNCNLVEGIGRENFKKLLELSVKNSYFIFDKKFYVQTEGVGMGLPLGPTFANSFMCYYEKLWLQNCPLDFKPLYYTRYVDDCFALFRKKSDADRFHNYLNSQHKNIKFSIEFENQRKLSFLDILIERSDDGFITSVFRKKTFTGLGSSYFSFTPLIYKISAIKTLIYRAYHISSSYINFHNEVEKLKSFFVNNGYPSTLFQKITKDFLSKIYSNESKLNFDIPKLPLYFKFPYFGIQSDKLKIELIKIIEKHFPFIDPKIILVNNYKIGNFFKVKDLLPKDCISYVVYKYCCPLCGGSYIGSTTKSLRCRVSQHASISSRTNLPVKTAKSSIMEHTKTSCSVNINMDNFSVLDRFSSSEFGLRILEGIYIKKEKPLLNNQDTCVPLYVTL